MQVFNRFRMFVKARRVLSPFVSSPAQPDTMAEMKA